MLEGTHPFLNCRHTKIDFKTPRVIWEKECMNHKTGSVQNVVQQMQNDMEDGIHPLLKCRSMQNLA